VTGWGGARMGSSKGLAEVATRFPLHVWFPGESSLVVFQLHFNRVPVKMIQSRIRFRVGARVRGSACFYCTLL